MAKAEQPQAEISEQGCFLSRSDNNATDDQDLLFAFWRPDGRLSTSDSSDVVLISENNRITLNKGFSRAALERATEKDSSAEEKLDERGGPPVSKKAKRDSPPATLASLIFCGCVGSSGSG